LRVKVERGIGQAVDLLAEPTIKSLVVGPDDHARVRVHTVSSWGMAKKTYEPRGFYNMLMGHAENMHLSCTVTTA